MALALEGMTVLDVSQVAAVPMAARHLADFGADVIHIEKTVTGDSFRGVGRADISPELVHYNWENFNRNKRSMAIDLSQDEGQKIVYKLIEKADVFMTNMRLFEREKFHVEYETLTEINPKIIYGSLTGHGKNGPDRNAPAFDATAYWARSGIPHVLAEPGMPPPSQTIAFGDNVAALALACGIITALLVRERTGIGQEVDISLLHTGIYQISSDISRALATGQDCEDWKPRSKEDSPNALSGLKQTMDDRWLFFVIGQTDRYWSKYCKAIEREDLKNDPRFDTFEHRVENHIELYRILEKVFLSKTLEEWKARLEGIPVAAVQNLREVIADPQVRANNIFVPFNHPIYGRMEVVTNLVKLNKTPATIRTSAPEYGQHTEEILLENGYTWDEITQFKERGIIS